MTIRGFVATLLGVLSTGVVRLSRASQSTFELFPSSHEEYDPWILDPEHGYGSPFGGFGRATPSRLANLPLFLPNTNVQEPGATPFHTKVRDVFGRLYVCRVYHEDELDPVSLYKQGMFEIPKLKAPEPPKTVTDAAPSSDTLIPSEENSLEKIPEGTSMVRTTRKGDGEGDVDFEIDVGFLDEPADIPTVQQLKRKNPKELLEEMERILKPLEGLCAQVHKGWWSYEWCYLESVSQFHVEISKATSSVQVTDITSLGDYDHRKVILLENDDQDKEATSSSIIINFLAEGRPEIAQVQDFYQHGTLCSGTDTERQSIVQLVCCSKYIMEKRKGLIHRDNIHVNTNIMSIYEVEESKTNICTYNVTVCTPLLCEDYDKEKEKHVSALAKYGTEGKLKDKHAKPTPPRKKNESIMEILEQTLGGFCLQTSTGGWWTYEICHKKSIRQFHEVLGSKKSKSGGSYTARSTEADHNLGKYRTNVYAAIVPEDEWKFVVNATRQKTGGGGGGAARIRRTYFELEYVGGDICDHSDVTDAAVVAGGATQKGIERSSSVRYQCGDTYDIFVSEDSTCHYIVDVELPDLCQHPLFQEPVSKKQVFKCLHVPEEMEEGEFADRDDDERAASTAVNLI